MSNLSTLPKGDSAWLLRKAIERIMEQVSVLETNIGSSTTGNSANTQIIFNDAGTLRGDTGLTYNKTTDILTAGSLIVPGNVQLATVSTLYVGTLANPKLKVDVGGTGITTITEATISGDLTVSTAARFNGGATAGHLNGSLFFGSSGGFLNLYSAATGFNLKDNTGAFNIINTTNAGVFTFGDGAGGTRMTLNSTGLGVGVVPQYKIHASQLVCASDPTQNGSAGRIYGAFLNAVGEPGLDLRRWDGGGGNNHGTTFIQTNLVGDTLFYNGLQASNTRATSLKMTLDASGNLLVGTATNTNNSRVFARGTGGVTTLAIQSSTGDTANPSLLVGKFDNDSTTSQILVRFTINNNAAGSGQITANGANQAAFGSFSDSRLKENIISLPSQLASILSLRPVEFDYKDRSGHQIGFVAQEMQEVYSDAVGEQNGFLTVTGWSKTEARLVSAIKELASKVQALEAKLA